MEIMYRLQQGNLQQVLEYTSIHRCSWSPKSKVFKLARLWEDHNTMADKVVSSNVLSSILRGLQCRTHGMHVHSFLQVEGSTPSGTTT